MADPDPAAAHRLDRLEGFLRDDPANPHLLADAFDAALQAGAVDRAGFHLRHARALGLDPAAWARREAHWLLAQQRWAEAKACLLALAGAGAAASPQAAAAALAHDLAYVELRQGDLAAGLRRLDPFVGADGVAAGSAVDPALEVLWLQLLHRAGGLARAMGWLRARERDGALHPAPAGVGSLIALDAGDHAASRRWADAALRGEVPPRVEALVARGSLALAECDAGLARSLLQAALERNGADGRVWSALGYAELLDRELRGARSAFEQATALLPEHVGTWHGLAWTALAQHDLPAARRAFEAALALDRNLAESHGGLAVVDVLGLDARSARGAIRRALGLDRACLSARYAEALLDGSAGGDTRSVLRLAERLLGGRQAPLGGDFVSLLRKAAR